MPYMGKVDVKASDIKRFSVTGSTSATHALSWTAPSEQALIITINGVKQQDGAYTIAGTPTTITLSSALVATDEMEVIGINDIGQTNTVAQDSIVTDMIRDDAVTTAKIADNQITTAKIADDQITSAKLANTINITSGNSLTIDSGATITNNGSALGFGGDVYFYGRLTSDQTITRDTTTKITNMLTNELDSHSAFDGTTFTVPSGKGGKYFLAGNIYHDFAAVGDDGTNMVTWIYINGSSVAENQFISVTYRDTRRIVISVSLIASLSPSDYVELYCYQADNNGGNARVLAPTTSLYGWRINQ